MPIQVIGAGLGRTGTLSLKAALKDLVSRNATTCWKSSPKNDVKAWDAASRGESIDWDALFEGYSATVDLPSALFYHELMEKYPAAKVILTVRDPDRWYDSMYNTIYFGHTSMPEWVFRLIPRLRVFQRMVDRLWEWIFPGTFEDRTSRSTHSTGHNEEVRRMCLPAAYWFTRSARAGTRFASSLACPSQRESRSRI